MKHRRRRGQPDAEPRLNLFQDAGNSLVRSRLDKVHEVSRLLGAARLHLQQAKCVSDRLQNDEKSSLEDYGYFGYIEEEAGPCCYQIADASDMLLEAKKRMSLEGTALRMALEEPAAKKPAAWQIWNGRAKKPAAKKPAAKKPAAKKPATATKKNKATKKKPAKKK